MIHMNFCLDQKNFFFTKSHRSFYLIYFLAMLFRSWILIFMHLKSAESHYLKHLILNSFYQYIVFQILNVESELIQSLVINFISIKQFFQEF